MPRRFRFCVGIALVAAGLAAGSRIGATVRVAAANGAAPVALQPLGAQVSRLVDALDYIGAPLSPADKQVLRAARADEDEARGTAAIQEVLDRLTLFEVHINPESRVHVTAGAAPPRLDQRGWRTFLIKVHNDAGVTAALKVTSPQAQPVFSRGPKGFSMDPRPPQTITKEDVADRWLDLSLFDKRPMTPTLSGLAIEYRIIQLYSRDVLQREATFSFNVGQGTQDLGFRAELPVLFTSRSARAVILRLRDEQDQRVPMASFIIRDKLGRVYPSPAKRLAPDFAFHPQIYRHDGEHLWLPGGDYDFEVGRGPEYLVQRQEVTIRDDPPMPPHENAQAAVLQTLAFTLRRWIDLASLGWYSGDHHVHAAGCLHYETPTEGVHPDDIMRHVLGEDLNVASVLTWGPGYYFQKQFFEGKDHRLSMPQHRLHYDVEVSGFPSSHSGHLVLLQLKDQDYPNTKVLEDWPTWNLPILQWAKAQGAVVGYAHSGWGLELKSTELPTRELPAFDGVGANEFIVDVTHDAVDFISTIDTPHTWELNIWYHTLNAGFRTRISGETDFPCIYGERVGLGRSYVQLGHGADTSGSPLTYARWVEGIRAGRAYATDGRSHLVDFRVNDVAMGVDGSELTLEAPATVRVTARVAALLDAATPAQPLRDRPVGEKPYWHLERARIGTTREVPVEVVVNGRVAATTTMVADGTLRDVAFDVPIARSSWIALRILPSSHTNPIFVLVGGRPIRASRASAEWCLAGVDRCWQQKSGRIAPAERAAAERAYDHARQVYRQRIAESDQE